MNKLESEKIEPILKNNHNEAFFRVWDKRDNYMDYVDDLYYFEEERIHDLDELNRRGLVLMWKVPVKDRDGNNYFEGDVVELWQTEREPENVPDKINIGSKENPKWIPHTPVKQWSVGLGVVRKDKTNFWVADGFVLDEIDPNGGLRLDWNKYEIIGNKYENPELLGEK